MKSNVHYFQITVSFVVSSEFTYITEEHIHITFSESNVITIKRALDVNKAHDHDNISVRMMKLYTKSVPHRLAFIFQKSPAADAFTTH